MLPPQMVGSGVVRTALTSLVASALVVVAAVTARAAPEPATPGPASSPAAPAPGAPIAPGPEEVIDQKLAVWRFDALGIDPELVARLETLFRRELDRLDKQAMPSRRDIDRAITGDARDCTGEDRCLAATRSSSPARSASSATPSCSRSRRSTSPPPSRCRRSRAIRCAVSPTS
jgi:hypothetical protein